MPAGLTLIAPGGIRTALEQLIPAFEKTSGHKVTPTFTSGGATKAKIIDGELIDVPVLQPPLDRVIASGNVVASSETPIATVSVVLAVQAGAPKPDISSPEAVKKLLLAAKSISCPGAARGAACGVSFEATLAALGIKDTVAPKVVAAPSGWESMKMLGRGEVELGVTFASENDPNPNVAMLGPMPRAISIPTGFVAFVHARSKEPDAAASLIRFLASADSAKVFVACGMRPGS
jgi:molybdate transport system substrate-binding protein